MALITPEEWVEWATNLLAQQTDPGSPLTADGWALGDAPASSHYNYIMNHAAGYASFVPKVLASSVAWGNIDWDSTTGGPTSPWGNDNNLFHCIFDETVNRWYVVNRDTSSGTVDIYDSEDGEDWGTGIQNITSTSEVVTDITRPVVGAGRLALGINNEVYSSSDFSVENMDGGTSDFDNMTKIREMCYDPISLLWMAVGEDNSGNGTIEYATEPDGAFAGLVVAGGNDFNSVAVSPAGNFVATANSSNWKASVANPLDWSTGGATGQEISRVMWSPYLDVFLGIGTGGDLYQSTDGTFWGTLLTNTSTVISTKDFVWTRNNIDESMTNLRPIGAVVGTDDLGFMHVGMLLSATYSEIYGGGGKVQWPWPATAGIANKASAYYGAKNGS